MTVLLTWLAVAWMVNVLGSYSVLKFREIWPKLVSLVRVGKIQL